MRDYIAIGADCTHLKILGIVLRHDNFSGSISEMRLALRVVNIITGVGGAALIFLSLWPGYASQWWILLFVLPLIALLGLAWLIVSVLRFISARRRSEHSPLGQVLLAPVTVLLTFNLLLFYVPRRIAFIACKTQFENQVASAPASSHCGIPFGRWLGVYHVDEWAADPRGGVYFRTGTGPDGIGPDVMSYGFAYRPNAHGTPFGGAWYSLHWIVGDWYWFRASDDWC